MARRAGTRAFARVAAASLLVTVLLIGARPAVANPPGAVGDGDPQTVGLRVGVSGVTNRSEVEARVEAPVPGGPLTVSARGLVPLTPYDLHLHPVSAPPVGLGSVISLADGTFELATSLPDSVQPGTHFVRVTDPATGTYLDTTGFEVGAPTEQGGAGTGAGAVPGTGAGNGSGSGELAATGPLVPRPVGGGEAETQSQGRLAFTGATLVGAVALAGALVVTGAAVAAGAARRRRRTRAA